MAAQTARGSSRRFHLPPLATSPWQAWDVAQPLPADELEFEARIVERNVRLDWTTAFEINSSYFEVERSIDRLNFDPIGRVPAAGNSGIALDYQYSDVHPGEIASPIYYRVKMVDGNGQGNYSVVRTVTFQGDGMPMLVVHPNPTSGNVMIELNGANDFKINDLSLRNAVGQEVLRKHWESGNHSTTLDLSRIAVGIYFVTLSTDRGPIQEKIIVQ